MICEKDLIAAVEFTTVNMFKIGYTF